MREEREAGFFKGPQRTKEKKRKIKKKRSLVLLKKGRFSPMISAHIQAVPPECALRACVL